MFRLKLSTQSLMICAILPLLLSMQIVSAQDATMTAEEGQDAAAVQTTLDAAGTPTATTTDSSTTAQPSLTAQPETPDYESLMEPFYLFRQRFMGTDVS
jgi:hypothetical protein